jgi:CheY-like chemotaxis protein
VDWVPLTSIDRRLTGTTHGLPQILTCLETDLPPSRHRKDLAGPRIPRVRLGSHLFDTQGAETADFDTTPLNQTLTEQPEYAVHDLAGKGRFAVILVSNLTRQDFLCDRRQRSAEFSRRMGVVRLFERRSKHAQRSVKLEVGRWLNSLCKGAEQLRFEQAPPSSVLDCPVTTPPQKTVLIVVDSPIVLEMVSKIVAELGHLPIRARDGKKALQLADHLVPDAFIVHLQMPMVNGLRVLKALRGDHRFKEPPIIMLTSVKDEDVIRQSTQGKATGYILKDDPTVILERLRGYLG